jgi:Recombination endonuclease VII
MGGTDQAAPCGSWKSRNRARLTAYMREWRKANPELAREQYRKQREAKRLKYPERRREDIRAYRARNPERARDQSSQSSLRCKRSKVHGVPDGPPPSVCEICAKPSTNKRHRVPVVLDHCHRTNRFRGWLCDSCNKILGLVKDNPDTLRAMALYLERDLGA